MIMDTRITMETHTNIRIRTRIPTITLCMRLHILTPPSIRMVILNARSRIRTPTATRIRIIIRMIPGTRINRKSRSRIGSL